MLNQFLRFAVGSGSSSGSSASASVGGASSVGPGVTLVGVSVMGVGNNDSHTTASVSGNPHHFTSTSEWSPTTNVSVIEELCKDLFPSPNKLQIEIKTS